MIHSVMFRDPRNNEFKLIFEGDPGEILTWFRGNVDNYALGHLFVHRPETLQHLNPSQYTMEMQVELVHQVLKDFIPADKSMYATRKVVDTINHYFGK